MLVVWLFVFILVLAWLTSFTYLLGRLATGRHSNGKAYKMRDAES